MIEKMSSEKLFFIALAAVLITLILSITYFNLVDNKEKINFGDYYGEYFV